ncbi:unnamed protein product, partial [Durusdinium trenchii]
MSGQVSGTGKKTCLDKAGLQMATNGMDRVGLEMDGAAHSLNNGSGSKMDDSNLPAWRRRRMPGIPEEEEELPEHMWGANSQSSGTQPAQGSSGLPAEGAQKFPVEEVMQTMSELQ